MFSTIQRSFRRYRLRILAIIIFGFLSGLSQSLGIAVVIPLFFLMTGESSGDDNIISNIITGAFTTLNIPITPILLLSLIVTLFIFKAIIILITRYMTSKVVADFERRVRTDILQKTLRSRWQYIIHQKIGYLESIITTDVEKSGNVFNVLANAILNITSFLMYASVAFSISTPITLATILIGIIIFLIIKPIFYKMRQMFKEVTKINKDVNHHIAENLLGMKTIKSYAVEKNILDKARRLFDRLGEIKTQTSFYRQSTIAFIEPMGFIVIAIIFVFSYKSPTFHIASFAVVMYLVQRMFVFIESVQGHLQSLNEFVPYLRAIRDYRNQTRDNAEESIGDRFATFNKEISFNKVSFGYDHSLDILSEISFSIKKGEMLGIVGRSGEGKTTIVDLLLRLLVPSSGNITADGYDINTFSTNSWRRELGYVPQDMFLINDTVENNIAFYDNKITEEDIVQAAKMANIYDTIDNLPDKFKTTIGERGLKLSGGQRQRIALARALAKKPQVLVLDEATSSIDSESEQLIKKAINNLKGNVTTIIIAHRMSTIVDADNVIVLNRGKIIEHGNPKNLSLDEKTHFSKLQMSGS